MKIYYLILFLLPILLCSCQRPTDVVTADNGLPPAIPVGLNIQYAVDGEIYISWNANNEGDLNGYNIYRKINNTAFTKIDFTSDTFYLDDSLNYNDDYIYRITAVDISGRESGPTDTVSAMPLNKYSPLTPFDIAINARNWEGKKSIFIKWLPRPETDIAGYKIYRSELQNFPADSSTLIAFTPAISFEDTTIHSMYKTFYYKIKAVDKGGLVSSESPAVADEILDIAGIVFPGNNSVTAPFTQFKITTLLVPATYEVILQSNEYTGELWRGQITSNVINDTINIPFNPIFLEQNKKYYWRIVTYTQSTDANSISNLYNFTLTP